MVGLVLTDVVDDDDDDGGDDGGDDDDDDKEESAIWMKVVGRVLSSKSRPDA